MDLSIIFPAFNEETKIGRDVEEAAAFLTRNGLAGEIVVVDDGSRDRTASAAEAVPLPPGVARNVIRCGRNRGKGHAVKLGMLASRGDLAMFADSGLSVPLEQALRGIELIRSGACAIAHGSRVLASSNVLLRPSPYRRVISRVVRRFLPRLMGFPPHITDSQCGFKVYRGDVARELYRLCETEGFMFDAEMILRARRAGHRIQEFPVDWSCDRDTRLHPAREPLPILRDLLLIRRRVGRSPRPG